MSWRQFSDRLLQWRFTLILASACLLSAQWMQNNAANLDRVSLQRERGLEDFEAVRRELAGRRGRHDASPDTLRAELREALSHRAIDALFPGLQLVPRSTHAGLILQLAPPPEPPR